MVNIDGFPFLTGKGDCKDPFHNSQPAILDESLVVQDEFPSLVAAIFSLGEQQPAQNLLLLTDCVSLPLEKKGGHCRSSKVVMINLN